MATRSTIALEFADGTVQAVYCHWDGYLSNNGKILQEHYIDPFKVRELIDLGSLSSLAPEIGTKHPFDNPHKYGSSEWKAWQDAHKNQCTFYGRDRGEQDVGAHHYSSVEAFFKEHSGEEFDYLMRRVGDRAVWFVRHRYTNGCWMPLVAELERESAEQE